MSTWEALNLIFSTVLRNRAYYPHLTGGETEAEKLWGARPKSRSRQGSEPLWAQGCGPCGSNALLSALGLQTATHPEPEKEGPPFMRKCVSSVMESSASFSRWVGDSSLQTLLVPPVSSAQEETAIKGKKRISLKFYACPLSQAEYLFPEHEL